MTYHKLYNVLGQLSAILTRALKSNTHPWLRVVHVGISVIYGRCQQARNQLGTPGGRRVFWEEPKCFELCAIVSKYIQQIFPGETKNFLGEAKPPWLRAWMSHLGSRVALLRFRNTEIIPKHPLQKVC